MTNMIQAQELTKSYGPLMAVNRASFEVPRGSVCGFLGPNGAGKSTTIRMITGLLRPDSGTLEVGGINVADEPMQVQRLIGYLPESTALHPELRVDEYLRYRGRLFGLHGKALSAAIDHGLSACGLHAMRRRLISGLSRGYRQRTGLAAALLADPPLLVLDEPTVGLDPVQQLAFRSLLAELAGERTVLLSSHVLAEVQASCTWLVVLRAGNVVGQGARDSLLEEAAGVRVVVEVASDGVEHFASALRALAVVHDVEKTQIDASFSQLCVTPVATGDPREVIIELAASTGVRLREVRREQANLESLFFSLAGAGTPSDWRGGDAQ